MRNRNRIYTWIIAILLATNLVTIGSMLYHTNAEEEMKGTSEMQMPGEQRARFFRQQLDLTAEQVNQFRNFNRQFNRTAKPIVLDLEQLRFEMLKEMGKEKPDTIQLAEIANQIGELHTILKGTTIDFYLNMKSVCNKDQKAKLYKIFYLMLDQEKNVQLPRGNHRGKRLNQ